MIPSGNSKANIDRFLGYQDNYDRYRPEAPPLVTGLLSTYLGRRPALVADIGCGTGLSTFLWKDAADQVTGVEPNPDMLGKAQEKLAALHAGSSALSFVQGYSNELPFPSGTVDIVTCSQSFHWMDPSSTLQEISRCLRTGGIFAAYDCDWPLMLHPAVEARYNGLIASADALLAERQPAAEQARKWDKEGHLARIKASGLFTYAREVVFHNMEACNAERYIGLTLSQGGIQSVLKLDPALLETDIAGFSAAVQDYFQGRTLQVPISYRMRIGVK
ncbi:methyltransferase domain-containing protein [Paenibacillus sp. MMS20-IR301]|uniref:class I SAM-dependent methyltransferase n=1 Tax=Paenibacillus sp. MMS20-IR301 TaxID=2895946 RepID=UPI0028E825BC|nr:methyltransferase domain-containing protein [Paenibacillus sp. MMS20-IR301]WNS42496.1 methyltransferase domain-containing protein [Paenibacillus sp. MMS20-IR301]